MIPDAIYDLKALEGLSQEEADIETAHLCDFKILFCKHCERCHKNMMHCSLSDDAYAILNKMLIVDGIILASPNYINQVTASMKALFDRSTHFIHCKRLLGKYIAGVVSSGSGQDKEVLDYIKYYGHTCGAQYSGGVSSAAQLIGEKQEEAILRQFCCSDLENPMGESKKDGFTKKCNAMVPANTQS